jgi:hypothetical protein
VQKVQIQDAKKEKNESKKISKILSNFDTYPLYSMED